MIDIVTNNVRQVGAPSEEDRIYISDKAYRRVHTQEFSDKRVFVLMGHTESAGGRYATFIEAAISVTEIGFENNIPVWTNKAWNEVFREIKRNYEDSIIVGWAMDLRGYSPKATPELQKIHREHFGGAHQLLMLVDSLQSEEEFYLSRSGNLVKRTGFFIYYKVEQKQPQKQPEVELEIPESLIESRRQKAIEKAVSQTPRYRYSVKSAHKRKYPVKGLAITAMLFAIIGIGAYSKFFPMIQKTSYDKVEVIEINNNDNSTEKESMATEKQEETITSAEQKESADTETVKVIPVEKVPQE